MHELYIVTVVVGVDRLWSRKIEDIADNYGDNVAVAPYIVGLVDNVPLRENCRASRSGASLSRYESLRCSRRA